MLDSSSTAGQFRFRIDKYAGIASADTFSPYGFLNYDYLINTSQLNAEIHVLITE
jgi:hypothetical protein